MEYAIGALHNTKNNSKNPHEIDDLKCHDTESSQIDNDNELSECKVCEKKIISKIASQDHNRKWHLTLGQGNTFSYKCD